MQQDFKQQHWVDGENNPAGGVTSGNGFTISWQNGPLAMNGYRCEPNGAFVEDVIAAAIGRINFYQASRFHSEYNAVALDHLYQALNALNSRTKDRGARGVEGSHHL
jgi:hypothetical protein